MLSRLGQAGEHRHGASGYAARGYEGVRDAFAAAQAADQEGGGQLCVYRHGEKVVDLWAGRDRENDRPYGQETITVIMSCTKGATAAVVHRLAERGLIDYEAPVADYWPEFAAGGKADARVWHLLSHSVGLPGVDPESGVTAHDMLYPERHVPALEAMAPVWTPGASCHYHPITYGSLLNEVVRRVSARPSRRCSPRRSPGRWPRASGSVCRRPRSRASRRTSRRRRASAPSRSRR